MLLSGCGARKQGLQPIAPLLFRSATLHFGEFGQSPVDIQYFERRIRGRFGFGGILGDSIGVINTLYIGAAVSGLAAIWILSGPVIRIRDQPEPVTE